MHKSQPKGTHVVELTCEICLELLSTKFTSHDTGCTYIVCIGCIAKYIETKLEDDVSDILCPALHCYHYLDPLLCRPQIPHQLFDKWCDLLCDSFVLGFDQAYCPNKNCSALVLNECDDNVKRFECLNCKKPFCFWCKKPWHEENRCNENVNANDEMFLKLVKTENWKKCPRCGHCVERVSGCRIMLCRCGVRFCYDCRKMINNCICASFNLVLFNLVLFIFGLIITCIVIWILFWGLPNLWEFLPGHSFKSQSWQPY